MMSLSSIKSKAVFTFSLEAALIWVAVSRALIYDLNPMRYFDERGFITWLSFLQLLFIGYLCHKIAKLRLEQNPSIRDWRNPGRAWQVMMLGFIFLGLDEYFQIHERLDLFIQGLFGLENTIFWSRIDDFIILLYAIIGIVFLKAFNSEMKHFSLSSKWFSIGFGLCFVTIGLDMLSHDTAAIFTFVTDLDQLKALNAWSKTLEEVFKIFAEGAFIIAFASCLKIARTKLQGGSTVNQ